jgi:hypothetical protein
VLTHFSQGWSSGWHKWPAAVCTAVCHLRLRCVISSREKSAPGDDARFGYTDGIPGHNTGAYYLPSKDATMIVFMDSQIETPDLGVANSIVRGFTQILFPENVAYAGGVKK